MRQSTITEAGLKPLQGAPLRDGEREARIWVGFGLIHPDAMLRLVRDANGSIHGDIVVWFEPSEYPQDAAYNRQLTQQLEHACGRHIETRRVTACTARPTSRRSWSALYGWMTAQGLWELPDESKLPQQQFVVSDGVAMLVELRDGPHYRAYEYSNPMFREEPESHGAAKILRAVQDISPVP